LIKFGLSHVASGRVCAVIAWRFAQHPRARQPALHRHRAALTRGSVRRIVRVSVRANLARLFVHRASSALQVWASSEVCSVLTAIVSNYVFKPTAEEVARSIHSPSRGGGLTRR
jgi:hypothetical protein